MNVALFGKSIADKDISYVQTLFDGLHRMGGRIWVYPAFLQVLKEKISFSTVPEPFSGQEDIRGKADYLFSIGGDGTILDAIPLVGDSNIPILGINMGRLGFLSGISKEEIQQAFEQIAGRNYLLDQRSLIRLDAPENIFGQYNYALNDLTIYRGSQTSILTLYTYIDGEFLNTYWADGLIVATPTGSTAYSLSCTGPIITPDSENFVITPIASHNLTVRPIVVPDKCTIKIVVGGRGVDCHAALDSRNARIDSPVEMILRKENFKINLIRMPGRNFFQTIREKLKWGLDIRN